MPKSKPHKVTERAERRAFSEFSSSILLILLIWLVAELIFLPLAAESFTGEAAKRVTSIVATLFVIAIIIPITRMIRHADPTIDLIGRSMAKNRFTKTRHAKMQPFFKDISWALLMAILGSITSSLVYWINTVLGGMTLLATLIAVAILLLQAASSWTQGK